MVGKRKKISQPLDDDDTSGSTGTLTVSHSGRAALRREQWERLGNEHHKKEKKTTCRKMLKAQTSERKNRWCTNKLVGMSSLKEGAV
jgi:hypothetical protein